ncbi:rna-directed dna polymerase from mobile element jockey-like [Limosa lapponica baueri]|uniref:Rna-directed dna polymerase from mobile element jockey-like n=1 Tax=Limosa lapponica baueri TaxID=1758121 RepID=A0A2I0TMP0_LIMLA|nr:rna-directed dna polymerase from mobile element jockey-like [Limosa lapponica baueri]
MIFKLSLKGGGVGKSISRDKRVIDGLGTMAVPGNGQVEVRPSYTKKVVGPVAQLKCFYTNAHKQEELEATVQQDSYDVVTITETWWDDSHDWSAAMGGYKLFRRDRQGRTGVCGQNNPSYLSRLDCLYDFKNSFNKCPECLAETKHPFSDDET